MAYIISVNATIVSQSGGTCVCPPDSPDLCDSDPEYMLCVQEISRDLVTATAAISALTTSCMGLFANMPIALAPGMGLNAYFAYTVVGYHGSGLIPFRVALTAVFLEGFVFVGLTLCGLRQWLARAIPASIKLATGVGIGLYLTLIGLTYSAGIGMSHDRRRGVEKMDRFTNGNPRSGARRCLNAIRIGRLHSSAPGPGVRLVSFVR